MNAVEQPASARASRSLRNTVAGLPSSRNRRMAWQARWRIVKPLADAVAWRARAFGLPQPLERARRGHAGAQATTGARFRQRPQ